MNLGIDFYGTITNGERPYRILASTVLASGGEVHIVTAVLAKNEHIVRRRIEQSEVPYTKIHVVHYNRDNFMDNFNDVPALKADVIEKLNLDLFVDDRVDVCEELTARGIDCLLAVAFERPE